MLCFHAAQTGKRLLRTQNVSEQNQKKFFVPNTKFVPATNVARAGNGETFVSATNVSQFAQHGNTTFILCNVSADNVSSFAKAFILEFQLF